MIRGLPSAWRRHCRDSDYVVSDCGYLRVTRSSKIKRFGLEDVESAKASELSNDSGGQRAVKRDVSFASHEEPERHATYET